jgi:hypothetical protein
MRANGTFSVKAFNPAPVTVEPAISTALPVGVASTSGRDRTGEYFAIVPSSGTGQLAGITGDGGLAVAPDGTHRIWLEYQVGG